MKASSKTARFCWQKWMYVIALVAATTASAAATLRDVTLDTASNQGARLTLTLSAPVQQKVFALDNPARLVVDLPDTTLVSGLKLPQGAGSVVALRSGNQPNGHCDWCCN